jgi:hypothetical protein
MTSMRATILFTVLALAGCNDSTKAVDSGAPGDSPQAAEEGGGEGAAKPSEPLPDAAALLEKSVEASGGREKIGAIQSFHFAGKVSAPKLNITGSVETWWKGGDFYMVQTIEGIGTNRSGKQGDVIWTEEPINGLRKLDGQEAEQHSWASSLLLAADWKKYFTEAQTVAAKDHDGKPAYDVKLTSKSGAELTLTIDKESSLVVAQDFEVVNPMGRTPVKMALEEYREVEGVKIPFRQSSDLGVLQLSQEISDVKFNVEVDASKFAMPIGDTEVVEGHPKEEDEEEEK